MRITLGHILLTFSLCSQTIGDSIEEKNGIYLVAKGDALVLTCTGHFSHMEGKGTRWLREGNILHQSFPPDWRSDHADSHERSFDVINGFIHKMTIKHVVEKDVGLYICQTLDSQHNTHYDVAILSQTSITFSEEIKKDNKPIEGTCKISIYHDKELIIEKSQLRFTASVNGLDIAKGTMVYNDIDGKNKDFIQHFAFTGRRAYNKKSLNCNVEYSSLTNRKIMFAADLDIEYSPREITLKWNKTIMYVGEVIECIADGNPAPILKWNSKASQLNQERDSNILFIFRNMSGEQSWQCSCSNHNEVEAVQFNFTVGSTEGKECIFEDARSYARTVALAVLLTIFVAIVIVLILLRIGLFRDISMWYSRHKKKNSSEMSDLKPPRQPEDDPEMQSPLLDEGDKDPSENAPQDATPNPQITDRYSGNTKQEQVLSDKTTALRITTSPQQLMKISSDGRLNLSEDVLSELRTVQGDIVVVAIVGYYRTGKSYLLNQLAGEESPGFKLGSTIEGETKGIWIMVRPHPTKQDTQLVLIDTEGLGDADGKLPRQDAWIYTLAALFSSTLIHNAFGNINEDTIDQWNFVSEMSKKVHIGREYMEDDPDFGMYFPKFILTLRDFTLTLTKGGMEITADEHMESILSQKANRKPEYNEKRTKISRYFPDKKCFLFDRPSEKREELTRLDSIPSGDLSEEFQENVSKFLEFVYKECGPLQLPNGHKMDGAALATLIQHYVKALNQDEGLSIESAVGKVIHEETKMAIENAEKSYREYMADHVPLPTIDLLTFTNGAKAALDLARKSFVQGIVPGQEGEDLKLFQDKMAAIQKSFDTDNKRLSREKCQAKLDDLNRNMQRKLQNNDYIKLGGYLEFKTDIQDIVDKYRKICDLGIEKEEKLSEYLGQLQSNADGIWSTDQQMMKIDKKYEAENMRKLTDDRLRKRSDMDQEKDIQRGMEEVNKMMLKDLEEKRKMELEEMHRRFEHVQNERKKQVSRLLKEGLEEQAKMLNNFIYEQNKSFMHRREQLDELTTKFKKQQ